LSALLLVIGFKKPVQNRAADNGLRLLPKVGLNLPVWWKR